MTDRISDVQRRPADLPRRDVLQTAALGLLGANALPLLGCAGTEPSPGAETARNPLQTVGGTTPAVQRARLGLQLYTVREAYKTDLPGTLKKVAALGVETAFWYDGMTMEQGAAAIREAGLTVSSAHVEIPVGDARIAMLDAAKTYDTTRMIWHGWPGHNSADIVRIPGKRAAFLHIKDGPAVYHETLATDNPDPMTAVGKGTQDFTSIARAGSGNVEWMIVEMDKVKGDVFVALEESVRYLTTNNLAAGKPAT